MMLIQELRESLVNIANIPNETWFTSLEGRKRAEIEFHDRDRDHKSREELQERDPEAYSKRYGNRKYYTATQRSDHYVEAWIREHARGKVFLDYACGNGKNAIKAARGGAELAVGFDISSVAVEISRDKAREAGLESKTFFFQADAEMTRLPSNSMDAILCSGMLHHLDLSYAFPELRRILKPGGKILAIEALNYNPAMKLYRLLTPQMRTEWEKHHILSLKDLHFAKRFFDLGEVKYWHLASILTPHLKPLGRLLNAMDSVLTALPGLQLMSWMFTFELIKRKEDV